MILCPLEGLKPVITQGFGLNHEIYKQFGMLGHSGIDFRARVGIPVYASMDGLVKVIDSGKSGYGLHIKQRNTQMGRECVYGHLSAALAKNMTIVKMGELIGYTGNTGFSTGPHLHFGYRRLMGSILQDPFQYPVDQYSNGYYGYIDVSPFTITFKGTLTSNSLKL